MKLLVVLGAAVLAAPVIAQAPAAAPAPSGQSAEALFAQRLINDPRVEVLRPYGQPIGPVPRSDKTVQFGKALRVQIGSPSLEIGRIGVTTPTLKPVKEGDRIVVAFWARAQRTEDKAPGKLCRVQLEATPQIRAVFDQPFDVTPEWKMYKLSGKADRAYPAGGLNAAFHLACAKQVIDLGPVFILDYGA
ncbi:hypothetical protein [Sphingomonas hylomeconis]|uniref:Uncharacterized protein n=1 Tax=Sphingomonas hylomeconis TaxID=1395958 RepID=A0ABV7SVN6_9SPHN|nr:hypothetical protein [Sphingomonas hylomeconis]